MLKRLEGVAVQVNAIEEDFEKLTDAELRAETDVFRKRLKEARRDVEHGLRITLDHYRTREAQERMLEILQFKLDVLWSMLDAMSMAYELDRPPYHTVTRDRVWHKGISF